MRTDRTVARVAASAMTIAAVVAVAALGCGAGPRDTTVAVARRANENVSAAALGTTVVLAWSGAAAAGMDIYNAVSTDGGWTFGSPVRVNHVDGDATVGGEQPPRVALSGGVDAPPAITVVWTARGANGTRIVAARSSDGGATFGDAEVVPGGEAAGNRGWESIAAGDSGRVFALWLDHREVASKTVAPMHDHGAMAGMPGTASTGATAPPANRGAATAARGAPKGDPVERAGLSRLWFASLDGSVPPASLTGGVCYCCKTSVVTSGSRVFVAWRHVYPGNQRDIALAASQDGGRTFAAPVRVSEDHWQFDGCPENGPALAVDRSGAVHVAWVTPLEGKEGAALALYTASSHDGATFSPRTLVPTAGPAGHVQLVNAADGSLVLAWDEVSPAGRVVKAAVGTIGTDGGTTFAPPATMPGNGLYPALAATDHGVVMAWVRKSDSTIVVNHVP